MVDLHTFAIAGMIQPSGFKGRLTQWEILTEWGSSIIIIVHTHLRTLGPLLNSGRLGETDKGMFRNLSSGTPINPAEGEGEGDRHTEMYVCTHTRTRNIKK